MRGTLRTARRALVLGALLLVGVPVAGAAEERVDERAQAAFRAFAAAEGPARRRALDQLRKLGADALPVVLRGAGREPGSAAWETAVEAALAIDPAQAVAHVETCRTEWGLLGWMTPTGDGGRRVVDELLHRLLAARGPEWTKPLRLQPALLEDAFRVPPWAAVRLADALPGHLAWDEVPVRVRAGKLEVDVARDGKFAARVEPGRPAVLDVGPRERVRRVLVYRRLDAWYAASPHVLRAVLDDAAVEVLDVESDGDFTGPADLVRFGDGAFRPLREGTLAAVGERLLRFRLRREGAGFVLQTLTEAEPSWLDAPSARCVTALNQWRNAAGLPPVRADRARSRACGLHHAYWVRHGFTGHDEDPAQPEFTSEGAQAGRRSSVWSTADGPRFIETIGATVLHRISCLARPDEGAGVHVGGSGALLWGGAADASARGAPLLVPAPGQSDVPLVIEPETPTPDDQPSFYAARRGVPISVTWSGLADRAHADAVVEVFEDGATKPLAGTLFTPAKPYRRLASGFGDDTVTFVPDLILRPGTVHTVRYRARGREPVEIVWQFRTR